MTEHGRDRGNVWLPVLGFSVVIVALVFVFRPYLTPLILAALLAYLLNPLVDVVERRSMPRWAGIAIAYVAVAGLLAVGVFSVVPVLVNQIQEIQLQLAVFWPKVPGYLGQLVARFESRVPASADALGDPQAFGEEMVARAELWISEQLESAPGLLTAAVSNLVNIATFLVMVPFIAFFILRDGRDFKHAVIKLLPNRYFETTLHVMGGIGESVGRYLRGLLIEALILSIIATIGLVIVGLDYAVIVGVIAGISNLVPYLGPIVGVLVGVIVVLTTGSGTLLGVLIVFAIAQFVDNWFIQPTVMSRSVNLHPLLIFIAVILGGTYGGLWGMILAVPVTGAVVVSIKRLREGLRPPVYPYGLGDEGESV